MTKCDVVVTGAAGFIGRYLCEHLTQRGVRVLGIDKRDVQVPFDFICHDLTQPLAGRITAQVCMHLAAAVGGILYNQSEEADILDYNAAINQRVLEICKAGGCARMVFFSSINVFESDPVFAHAPVRTSPAVTPYARSKAQGERMFAGEFPHFVALRPTNVFGKHQVRTHDVIGESHVIPDLIKKISENDVVQIFGDGTQRRNFVHALDVVRFADLATRISGQRYFNLRSNLTIAIAQLARDLAAFLKRDVKFEFAPSYMRFETFRIEDFDLAPATAMGWDPRIHSIADGLMV